MSAGREGVDLFQDGEVVELLTELERNTSEEIRMRRAHFRVQIKAAVVLRPASASEQMKLKLQGVTGDLSEGGCLTLFPLPVSVGDVFRLEFDRKILNLPLTFARCVRCIL
ncbi:MAG: PilZ domain-containing protein, partial [Parvularculaceae bacterium]|nr:PilZ domain-containing protein [Parvularculaceae bacterium]